jgi:hypothetical protein
MNLQRTGKIVRGTSGRRTGGRERVATLVESRRMNLGGTTTRDNLMPEPPRCAFPGCQEWCSHNHHITYDPEVTKRLCVRHHEEITILNGQQARKYRVPLSNKFRWRIWFQWTQGKMKVRRTRKSLEWTEGWQDQLAAQPEVPRAPETPVILARTGPIAQTKRQRPKKGRSQRKRATVRKTVGARDRRKAENRKPGRKERRLT